MVAVVIRLLFALFLISDPVFAADDPLCAWQHQAVTLIAAKRCPVQAVELRALAAMMEIGRLDVMPYMEAGDDVLGYKADRFSGFFLRVDSLAQFIKCRPEMQSSYLAVFFENKSSAGNRAWVRRFNRYVAMYRKYKFTRMGGLTLCKSEGGAMEFNINGVKGRIEFENDSRVNVWELENELLREFATLPKRKAIKYLQAYDILFAEIRKIKADHEATYVPFGYWRDEHQCELFRGGQAA